MSTTLSKVVLVAGGWLVGIAALAQPQQGAPAGAVDSSWHPVFAAGLTVGGDTVAKFQMVDGSTKSLSGGGLVHLYGGIRRQFGLWALQGSAGYQVDDVVAPNGSARFERFPLEALAQYRANELVSIGAGLRYVTGARYSASGAAASTWLPNNVSLTVSPSLFFEGDYALSEKANLAVRLVSETYKDAWGGSFKGDHIGFYIKGIF